MCRSYGFENKYHPLIYTIEGKIIGGALEFKEHVKDRYDKMLTIPKETQKARAKLTNDDNDVAMRRKRDGDTLNERIEETLEKLKKKPCTNNIQDSFYDLQFENGIPFQIRKTNLLRE